MEEGDGQHIQRTIAWECRAVPASPQPWHSVSMSRAMAAWPQVMRLRRPRSGSPSMCLTLG
eukprot:5057318-Lingulodinium_polyedra.AAC.1